MHSTDQETIQSRVARLERRLQVTERWLHLHEISWILVIVFSLVLVKMNHTSPVQAQSQPSKLRLRELDIIDDRGRERIVIAAPLPEPLVDGKVGHRIRMVSAAVQFKAPNGNEQGGIALSDDGSMLFGIDDERGHERAHLYYLPKRGSGVFLTGENEKETVSLLLPNGGGDPSLEMTNQAGKLVWTQPPKQ